MSAARVTWFGILFYNCIRFVLFIFYKVFFRLQCFNAENIPSPSTQQGVILAPNHASYLDPPLLGVTSKRFVTYLAKDYLFRNFLVGFVLRTIGAFPIKTKADDFRTVRDLIRLLKEGHCLVVFPEGTRSEDGNFKESEAGVGFLAAKSKAAVVPIYIQGTYEAFPRGVKFFKPHPIRVYYGKPFIPAQDEALKEASNPYLAISQKIMDEIKQLKKQSPTNG